MNTSSSDGRYPRWTARGDHLRALEEAGAQFVLCRRVSPDRRDARAPSRADWRREWPRWEAAFEWSAKWQVGVIPASLGMTVADVDSGDWRDAAAAAPPAVAVESSRAERRHLWYWDAKRRRNRQFRRRACAGDIRGASGYVVIWSETALSSLVDCVSRPRPALGGGVFLPAAFPSPPAPKNGTARAVPDTAAPVSGCEDARVGERNNRLFDELRFWAYAHAPRDGDGWDGWLSACTARALGLNAGIIEPLPADEVRATAASVARYVWAGGRGAPVEDRSSDVQAARGRKSGEVRRARSYFRDAQIVRAHAAGVGYKRLSLKFGLSISAVRHICKRGAQNPRFYGLLE